MTKNTPSLPNQPAEVVLYGSCGAGNEWRTPLIEQCEQLGRTYFDPYTPEGWDVDRISHEVQALYNSQQTFVGVHAGSKGYGSLAEIGWSIVSALMEPKVLNFFVETPGESHARSDVFVGTRQLAVELSAAILKMRPQLFSMSDTYEDFLNTSLESIGQSVSRIIEDDTDLRAVTEETRHEVAVFGTAREKTNSEPSAVDSVISGLDGFGTPVYDARRPSWSFQEHHPIDMRHKLGASVLVQCIDNHSPSFGSLVETGLLTAISILQNRPIGIYIDDYINPSTGAINSHDYPNRLRLMTRAHIEQVIKVLPDHVYLASSVDELTEFAKHEYQKLGHTFIELLHSDMDLCFEEESTTE